MPKMDEEGSNRRQDTCDKRGKPWEVHEVHALCSYVKMHAAILFGTKGRGSLGVEKQKVDAWEDCRKTIIAAGGRQDRSWEKIRKKWQDMASKAKKYNLQRSLQVNGTGGGEFVSPHEQYEWVLEALPDDLRDGITPIGGTETTPSSTKASNNGQPLATQRTEEGSKAPSSVCVQRVLHRTPPAACQPLWTPKMIEDPKISSGVCVVRAPTANTGTGKTVKSVKRHITRTESETEDSQESQQETKKQSKKGKKVKKNSDEVDLLTLNKSLMSTEEQKVNALEGILTTLKGIHGILERLCEALPKTVTEQ